MNLPIFGACLLARIKEWEAAVCDKQIIKVLNAHTTTSYYPLSPLSLAGSKLSCFIFSGAPKIQINKLKQHARRIQNKSAEGLSLIC